MTYQVHEWHPISKIFAKMPEKSTETVPFKRLSEEDQLVKGPQPDPVSVEQLAADMLARQARGVRPLIEPITLFENLVLDGRARQAACLMAGIEPVYSIVTFPTWDEATKWAWSKNQLRRHVSMTQRVYSAYRATGLPRGRPSENPSRDGITWPDGASKLFTRAEAAAMFDVGTRSIERVATIERRGTAALKEAAERDQVPLRDAAVVAMLPEQEQQEAVAGGRAGVRRAAASRTRAVVHPVTTRRDESVVRQPVPMKPESETEIAMRRIRTTGEVFDTLVRSADEAERAVQLLAEGDVVLTPDHEELGHVAVSKLRTIADWLETLLNSRGRDQDAALQALLNEEGGKT